MPTTLEQELIIRHFEDPVTPERSADFLDHIYEENRRHQYEQDLQILEDNATGHRAELVHIPVPGYDSQIMEDIVEEHYRDRQTEYAVVMQPDATGAYTPTDILLALYPNPSQDDPTPVCESRFMSELQLMSKETRLHVQSTCTDPEAPLQSIHYIPEKVLEAWRGNQQSHELYLDGYLVAITYDPIISESGKVTSVEVTALYEWVPNHADHQEVAPETIKESRPDPSQLQSEEHMRIRLDGKGYLKEVFKDGSWEAEIIPFDSPEAEMRYSALLEQLYLMQEGKGGELPEATIIQQPDGSYQHWKSEYVITGEGIVLISTRLADPSIHDILLLQIPVIDIQSEPITFPFATELVLRETDDGRVAQISFPGMEEPLTVAAEDYLILWQKGLLDSIESILLQGEVTTLEDVYTWLLEDIKEMEESDSDDESEVSAIQLPQYVPAQIQTVHKEDQRSAPEQLRVVRLSFGSDDQGRSADFGRRIFSPGVEITRKQGRLVSRRIEPDSILETEITREPEAHDQTIPVEHVHQTESLSIILPLQVQENFSAEPPLSIAPSQLPKIETIQLLDTFVNQATPPILPQAEIVMRIPEKIPRPNPKVVDPQLPEPVRVFHVPDVSLPFEPEITPSPPSLAPDSRISYSVAYEPVPETWNVSPKRPHTPDSIVSLAQPAPQPERIQLSQYIQNPTTQNQEQIQIREHLTEIPVFFTQSTPAEQERVVVRQNHVQRTTEQTFQEISTKRDVKEVRRTTVRAAGTAKPASVLNSRTTTVQNDALITEPVQGTAATNQVQGTRSRARHVSSRQAEEVLYESVAGDMREFSINDLPTALQANALRVAERITNELRAEIGFIIPEKEIQVRRETPGVYAVMVSVRDRQRNVHTKIVHIPES